MTEATLTINLASENNRTLCEPFNSLTTAEDVCISVCKQLSIGPLARHLFALRVTDKQIFLTPSATFKKKQTLDFRIRFKVPLGQDKKTPKLRKIDVSAYNYYFQQARLDVLENKIPGLVYEKYKRELVGLGITDMYRVILEKGISKEIVANDYKKYLPKAAIKKHSFFIKKPISDNLGKLQKTDRLDESYVKAEYIKQLDKIAPEYLSETYKAVTDLNEPLPRAITVKVSPFDVTEPGLKYSLSKKDEWNLICTIEDLGFISIRNDGAIEISRKNGIPFYIKFHSVDTMYSFISLVDGYYRLMCKWTFNVCREVTTPSLKKLHTMKCHGPVGGEFSYAKLESKRSNGVGCFIIREGDYNTYYIDVCTKDGLKPKTYKLEKIKDENFIFNDDMTTYSSIPQLIAAYSDPLGKVYLQECIPPSEYDLSPLLLCRNDNVVSDFLTDSSSLNAVIPQGPVCINYKDLQVFKGLAKDGSSGVTLVYRGMWKIARGKKMEVALKVLKRESLDKYLKDYLNLVGQWAFLQSTSIVRFFGLAVAVNSVALVTEYFKLGPLDQYLRENKDVIKTVDMIEAASNLASAVWHLKENNIVHGRIRCRKLMVHCHEKNSFTVKLTDPGLHNLPDINEIHWIPIEAYNCIDFAKRSSADIWALATTLYEIFTYGKVIPQVDHVQTMRWYISGKRLPQPPGCPNEIYELMLECWDPDPHSRKQSQEISRDINQLLYQVYNSRRQHSYDTIKKSTAVSSNYSLNSNTTETTDVYDLLSATDPDNSSTRSESSFSNASSHQWLLSSQDLVNFDMDAGESSDFGMVFPNLNFATCTSQDSLDSMQSIFELDDECSVVLQGRIGMGFYGDVYRGTLEYVNGDTEPKLVAVKKLRSSAVSSCLEDFEREITIMKTLNHQNIVEILGVLRNPEITLVMEFVQHGSLQSYLKINRETLKIKQLLKYSSDIAKGMDYLGKKNIVHRDLATRNILVADENHVKISDFGLAQFMGSNDYYILKSPNRELPIKWYSPESLAEGKFSVKSDVWSYGVTIYEMFNFGEEPPILAMTDTVPEGQEQAAILSAITNGARLPCPQTCPRNVYVRLIHPCWQDDPHCRPSFSQIDLDIEDLITQY